MSDTKIHKEERKFLAGLLPFNKVSLSVRKKWDRWNKEVRRWKMQHTKRLKRLLKRDAEQQREEQP